MRKAHTRPTTIPAIAPPDKVNPEESEDVEEDVDRLEVAVVAVVAVVWVAVEIEAVAVDASGTSTLIPRKSPPAEVAHFQAVQEELTGSLSLCSLFGQFAP